MFGLTTNPLVVITVLAALAALAVAFGYWLTFREAARHRKNLVAAARAIPDCITEARLAHLPQPAQRYLRYAGVVGKPVPRLVTLTQKGRIRSSSDAAWMSLEANETYSTNPPAFLWEASLPGKMLALATRRDLYLDGKCSIRIQLLGLLPLASENGVELRKAGLVRYLNEMMWFPAALLGPNVRLVEIDDNSFTAILTDHGETARGQFFIDEAGRLTNFRAQRYNTSTRSIEIWETPVTDYRDFAGYRLPATGAARWVASGGELTYIELSIGDVAYLD